MSLDAFGVEQLCLEAFAAADADGSGSIDFEEFARWAMSSPHLIDFFETHNVVFGAPPQSIVRRRPRGRSPFFARSPIAFRRANMRRLPLHAKV